MLVAPEPPWSRLHVQPPNRMQLRVNKKEQPRSPFPPLQRHLRGPSNRIAMFPSEITWFFWFGPGPFPSFLRWPSALPARPGPLRARLHCAYQAPGSRVPPLNAKCARLSGLFGAKGCECGCAFSLGRWGEQFVPSSSSPILKIFQFRTFLYYSSGRNPIKFLARPRR